MTQQSEDCPEKRDLPTSHLQSGGLVVRVKGGYKM